MKILIQPQRQEEFAVEYVLRAKEREIVLNRIWRQFAWETLMLLIEEEGHSMREVGPCAVRVYEYLLEVACAYLAVFPNSARQRYLKDRVQWDLLSMLETYELMTSAGSFEKAELEVINSAAANIQSLLNTLGH